MTEDVCYLLERGSRAKQAAGGGVAEHVSSPGAYFSTAMCLFNDRLHSVTRYRCPHWPLVPQENLPMLAGRSALSEIDDDRLAYVLG